VISKFSVYSKDLSELDLLGAMYAITSQDMLDYVKTQCNGDLLLTVKKGHVFNGLISLLLLVYPGWLLFEYSCKKQQHTH